MVGGLMQAASNVYRKYLRNKGATPAGVEPLSSSR